jgi:hypothetical protein
MENEVNSLLRELTSASIAYREALYWRGKNKLRGRKGAEARARLDAEIEAARHRVNTAENKALDYLRGFKINY